LETPKFKLADIFNGIIIPLILVLLIFFLAIYINPTGQQHIIGETNTIAVILTQGFAQMIIMGIPLVIGLLWNKWAGGAAGFIMGGMYYVASAGTYNGTYAAAGVTTYNFFGDMSMLGYLVNAIVIGYMAGALSGGSTNFKRMLGAGMTAAVVTAVIQAYLNYTVSLPPAQAMNHGLWEDTSLGFAGVYGFVIAFVPSIALGIIVPVIAKVMTWYGIQPLKH
jgi:hypothetical protein